MMYSSPVSSSSLSSSSSSALRSFAVDVHSPPDLNQTSSSMDLLINTTTSADGTTVIPQTVSTTSIQSSTLVPFSSRSTASAAVNDQQQINSININSNNFSNFTKSISSSIEESIGNSQSHSQNQSNPSSCRENTNKHSISMDSNDINLLQGTNLCSINSSIVPCHSHVAHTSSSSPNHPSHVVGLDLVQNSKNSVSISTVVAPVSNGCLDSISTNSQPNQTSNICAESSSLRAPHGPILLTSSTTFVNSVSAAASTASTASPSDFLSRIQQSLREVSIETNNSNNNVHSSCECKIDDETFCLIVDDNYDAFKLSSNESTVARTRALALAVEKEKTLSELRQHLSSWLNVPIQDIAAAYTLTTHVNKSTLHINFSSLDALSAALLKCEFLIRCGTSTSTDAWTAVKPCNHITRHQLPELIKMTFIPAEVNCNYDDVFKKKVKVLLDEMKLPYTTFWFPSSVSFNHKDLRRSIFVLPRQVQNLQPLIESLHMRYMLAGCKVRVQGVNSIALQRCSQCGRLGHDQNNCEDYGGIAIRLIGKKPLSYATMQQIQSLTGAHKAFLGSSTSVLQPSRRMFLLFKSDESAEQNENILKQLPLVMKQLIRDDRLHGLPQIVDVKTRSHGCSECGELKREHVCPFLNNQNRSMFKSNSSNAQPSIHSLTSASATVTVDATTPDLMCRSWRRLKKCTHMHNCTYQHPPEHIVIKQNCFSFQKTGTCSRGDQCNFAHIATFAAASSATAVLNQAYTQPAVPVTTSTAAPTIVSTNNTSNRNLSAQQPLVQMNDTQNQNNNINAAVTESLEGNKRKRVRTTVTTNVSESVAAASNMSSNPFQVLQDQEQSSTDDELSQHQRRKRSSTNTNSSTMMETDTQAEGFEEEEKVPQILSSSAASTSRGTTGSSTSASTAWSDIVDEDVDEVEESTRVARLATSITPVSSLSSLASPPKLSFNNLTRKNNNIHAAASAASLNRSSSTGSARASSRTSKQA